MTEYQTMEKNTDQLTPQKKERSKYLSVMSKKRYQEICQYVNNTVQDHSLSERIITGIKEIMHFDPNAKSTTPATIASTQKSRRQRAADLGISVYQYKKGFRPSNLSNIDDEVKA